MANVTPSDAASLKSVVDWRKFLTEYPPGTRAPVEGALEAGSENVIVPELLLHCYGTCQSQSYCAGKQRTRGFLFPGTDAQLNRDSILCYHCVKCQTFVKSYAIRFLGDATTLATSKFADVSKLGEWPAFSFDTPARVLRLFELDREIYLKGRRAELEGLGVGAFTYYRRIVEDHKNRLLEEIIRVAERTSTSGEIVAQLRAAQAEISFSKAMDRVKDAIPQSLFINGQNPLALLHRALSRDIHRASDDKCLEIARDIRMVIFGLSERMSQALRDERELNDAVSRLMNPGE